MTNEEQEGYGWEITAVGADLGLDSEVGTLGGALQPRPDWSYTERFRIKDDDGAVYYSGMIWGDYGGFEPLDGLGAPSAGCTSIEFYGKTGWAAL